MRDERLREGPVVEYEVLTVFTHDREIEYPVWRKKYRNRKTGQRVSQTTLR